MGSTGPYESCIQLCMYMGNALNTAQDLGVAAGIRQNFRHWRRNESSAKDGTGSNRANNTHSSGDETYIDRCQEARGFGGVRVERARQVR